MATDYWPQEEGAIFDAGSYIVPAYPDGAISEMSSVKFGTTVAGRISVITSGAVTGDGFAIALRAATGAGAPSRIPILLYGIAKVTSAAIANYYCIVGSFAMNNGTTTYLCHASIAYNALVVGGASSYIMGLVISGAATGAATAGDEVLLLVGKTS